MLRFRSLDFAKILLLLLLDKCLFFYEVRFLLFHVFCIPFLARKIKTLYMKQLNEKNVRKCQVGEPAVHCTHL